MTYRDPRDEIIERLRTDLANKEEFLLAMQKSESEPEEPRLRFSPLRPFRNLPIVSFRGFVVVLLADFMDQPTAVSMPFWMLTFGTFFPIRWWLRSAMHLDDSEVYKLFMKKMRVRPPFNGDRYYRDV